MLRVIDKHRKHAHMIDSGLVPKSLLQASLDVWDEAYALGVQHGYRNSQVTVLAPTGTIGFMMDCDTTGVEPDIALVKYKKLVGGGLMKIVNQTVPMALTKLGYTAQQVKEIVEYIDENETIEGAPHIKDKDLPVFDCAFKPARGVRSIHYMGHIRMMGATQPFISGAISKTVNLPTEATVEDIEMAYMEAWKLGLKAIAVYRDGCKRSQPLNVSSGAGQEGGAGKEEPRAARRKLPDERKAITHKFSIGGHEGYVTAGLYEDGQPGELFIVMAKEGSVVSGLMDSFATSVSLALQYGVPLRVLVDKFSHTRFEPSGFTGNPAIPIAKSITDYIFRWLALKFLPTENEESGVEAAPDPAPAAGAPAPAAAPAPRSTHGGNSAVAVGNEALTSSFLNQQDAPPCHTCGSITVRNGACYKCLNCGATNGCS
jgi:ribonucleoside-diphosphate reductase alpha chain